MILAEKQKTDAEISRKLGRSERSIRAKRERMQLHTGRSKRINAANARCPFFEFYSSFKIRCKADRFTSITVSFSDAQRFEDFAHCFCQNCWEDCIFAQTIIANFADDEDGH